jgi:hypothetical protein
MLQGTLPTDRQSLVDLKTELRVFTDYFQCSLNAESQPCREYIVGSPQLVLARQYITPRLDPANDAFGYREVRDAEGDERDYWDYIYTCNMAVGLFNAVILALRDLDEATYSQGSTNQAEVPSHQRR